MNLIYRKHAIIRMFERGITDEDIRSVLLSGEVIVEYANDKPYPSRLILGWLNNNPTHVLTAENDDGDSVIITAYQPDPMLWENDFKRKKIMICPICRHGETVNGTASLTLERGATTLVFKAVPAQICNNCGEEYFSDEITQSILKQAESAVAQGVQIDVRQYKAA